MTKTTRRGLLALPLLAALAASPAFAADEILIGEIHPVTGPASFFGVPMSQAAKLAVAEINAAGGVKVGGKTYQLRLVTEDDQSNPAIGAGALKKLQSAGVRFIIGPLNTPVANALFPIIQRSAELTQIVDGATSDGLVNGKNIFRVAATLPLTYEPTLVDLVKAQSVKTVAIVTDRMHTGWMSLQPKLVTDIAANGAQVVAQEHMKFADTDFAAQLTKIKSLNPDMLILRAYPNESALMTKQARQLGYTGKIVWTNTPPPSTIKKNISNDEMQGVLLASTFMTDDYVRKGVPAAKKLHDAYVKAYGSEPGELSVMSYDAVYVLKAAIEKADSLDNAKVNAALQALKTTDIVAVGAYQPQDGGKLFNAGGDALISGLQQVWKGETWSFLGN